MEGSQSAALDPLRSVNPTEPSITVGLLPLTSGNTDFTGSHFRADRLRYLVRRERRSGKSSIVREEFYCRSQLTVICLPDAVIALGLIEPQQQL